MHYHRWQRHGDPLIVEKARVPTGAAHYEWKGDGVGYRSLHVWVRRHRGAPTECERCGATEGIEWANLSHEYRRDLADWIALCRRCHAQHDAKTHCPRGHPYAGPNLYVRPDGTGRGCRACRRRAD